MQRQDPVGITIRETQGKVNFTPDPQMLIMNGDVVFFSNETALSVTVTLAGKDFATAAPNSQSDGFAIAASGALVLGSSNQPFDPYTLQVSDQLILIRRTTAVSFDPLFVQPTKSTWVVWQNNDQEAHQPAPDAGIVWSSSPPPVAPFDWSAMVNFAKAGKYPYHCALHPNEKGRIVLADVAIQISPGTPATYKATSTTPGTYISWKNTDVTAHQPIPAAGTTWPVELAGPVAANDFSDPLQFPQGNFPYTCKLHPTESGQLTVTKATSKITAGTPATYSAVTVTAGDYVNWNNTDSKLTHQPVPDDGTTWTSQLPGPIAAKATSDGIQFPTAGSYSYHCKVHSGESGTIIVQPKS